ncbi:FAD-dependent thymidylate synthase [Paenibacillus alvei]|uniref:FAD-dependent thymidylate synthase n=1 Tax=Paenibacillus alvei TaxID=44250 RepID=UPI00227E26B2|nr:FAD-dependent thymidylate synthase [Paenibacillus alvei]MCY7487929.1 FAD-dependent thymidylate synthase [Paenibacillus alvei]
MKVMLMAKTQLCTKYQLEHTLEPFGAAEATDNQQIALTAIRNCYSPLPPSEILWQEGAKYFGDDGAKGKRLFNHIARSGHTSTLEHIHFVFIIEDISRAALAQLTRHRHYGFSVKSQRYVKYGSEDKTSGFDYVTPTFRNTTAVHYAQTGVSGVSWGHAEDVYRSAMESAQEYYDKLREAGVPAEDARMVLPNAATTHIVMSGNLRTVLEFYSKRREGSGAQWEIAQLAETMRELVEDEEPWTKDFFEVNM